MARKARQRISYVLPLANSAGGHRLGVNGLAVDGEQSILYSGGRDGVICAWDLEQKLSGEGIPSSQTSANETSKQTSQRSPSSTVWRAQVQAHTHWVNDIVLARSNSLLVSASSDLTVRAWRPQSGDQTSPQTLGLHSDYVKCLATPNNEADWVASGGLDHKVFLWDLNGAGQRLQIDVGDEEKTAKGSVYALGVGGGILASGGPECIVRIWDPRSGKRITKFVGHTDNVRDILINDSGDTILTASSDQTVKVWSVTAGRCMHTLTMHNDSVWSLSSEHPQLSVFYSSDRSGLVAKTDVRGTAEMDQGLCVAVCQEHGGVTKVISNGNHIWTATSSSSINRWVDVDTEAEIQWQAAQRQHRASSAASRRKNSTLPHTSNAPASNGSARTQLPLNSVLRLSTATAFTGPDVWESDVYSITSVRNGADEPPGDDSGDVVPLRALPEETIEGQNGLIKHVMLNDRRRVLTLDTAGEVVMWDLLKCQPIQSFGKRHLDEVLPEVNTFESVTNWCAVDTRTGRLACVLEENYCFDAEMYADELDIKENIEFREDQRINLGKWVLRYLFSNLIDEEIKRDEDYRKIASIGRLQDDKFRRSNAPGAIQLPSSSLAEWEDPAAVHSSAITPRAINGILRPTTPGLSIGIATPAAMPPHPGTLIESHLPPTAEEGSEIGNRLSQLSAPRSSSERNGDYFSTGTNSQNAPSSSDTGGKGPLTPNGSQEEKATTPEPDKEAHPKESSSIFGKKFRMSFGSKKIGRSPSVDQKKPVIVDEKSEDSDNSNVEEKKEVIEDNFLGVIQKLRQAYGTQSRESPGQALSTGITPSMPNETPVLKPPSWTSVIIEEDRPDSGGVADLYRGTVGSLGKDADIIEKVAPWWLGELLLKNQMPIKETVKVSFILQPYQDLLPSIASADGNARLNANRMLRARKILSYVAERVEAQPAQPDPNAMKPEEYLELYCQDKVIAPTVTLATLRTHIWKTGGDVMLYYKSNGKKSILGEKKEPSVRPENIGNGNGNGNGNGDGTQAQGLAVTGTQSESRS